MSLGIGFLILDVATLGSGSLIRGGIKQTAKNFVKIHKHHLVPKKVFKDNPELINLLLRDSGQNLKKLPAGFHGNHPSYSEYVQRRITEMKNNGTLNEQNIKVLQKELTSRINQAYDNYKVTGENLNTYFKALNGN